MPRSGIARSYGSSIFKFLGTFILFSIVAASIYIPTNSAQEFLFLHILASERLLLNGKMLTGRDAAHKRIQDMLAKGEKLPVDFTNRVIYYVGPVDPVRDEVVGPAGPTTSTRMDKFAEMMLGQTGLIAMVGKAERGPVAIDAIKKHKSAYMIAVGGAAYLVSRAIKSSKVLAFADLGMEAIYEFEVEDMPVTVAVDSQGTSLHTTGPAEWEAKIANFCNGRIPVVSKS